MSEAGSQTAPSAAPLPRTTVFVVALVVVVRARDRLARRRHA